MLDHVPTACGSTVCEPTERYTNYDRLIFAEYIPALATVLLASSASSQVLCVRIARSVYLLFAALCVGCVVLRFIDCNNSFVLID